MAITTKIKGLLIGKHVKTDKKGLASQLYTKNRLGEFKENKIQYSLVESAYLLKTKRLNVEDYKGKKLKFEDFINKCSRLEKNFLVRFYVFNDLRDKGYVVKTALKFGADFRVYERGVKPGQDHAKWIVYPVYESESLKWYELSAKTRVAHSTRKTLLIAVVDDENDVTYYNVAWTRP